MSICLRFGKCLADLPGNRGAILRTVSQFRRSNVRNISCSSCCMGRGGKKDDIPLSSLFQPVSVRPNPDDINVGAEIAGSLNKADLLRVLNQFYQRKDIKSLAFENGLDSKFFTGRTDMCSHNIGTYICRLLLLLFLLRSRGDLLARPTDI